MEKLRALWQGNLPLDEAFWTWAVIGGLIVNVTTSILFLALITAEQPWLALFVGYGLSVPYNVLAVVGVWRSSARYDGPDVHVQLARGASLAMMTVLSLT